jgi:GT2 family glycosyltransferase
MIGFSRACNEGIKAATGEMIVLLNDDVILLDQAKNQWLDTLYAPFSDETVGITGPLMNYCPHAQHNFLLFFCVMIRKKLIDQLAIYEEM